MPAHQDSCYVKWLSKSEIKIGVRGGKRGLSEEVKGGCKYGPQKEGWMQGWVFPRPHRVYVCVSVCVCELVRSVICSCRGHAGVHLRLFTFFLCFGTFLRPWQWRSCEWQHCVGKLCIRSRGALALICNCAICFLLTKRNFTWETMSNSSFCTSSAALRRASLCLPNVAASKPSSSGIHACDFKASWTTLPDATPVTQSNFLLKSEISVCCNDIRSYV